MDRIYWTWEIKGWMLKPIFILLLVFLAVSQPAFAERTHHYFFGNSGYQDKVYDSVVDLGQDICPRYYNNIYGHVQKNSGYDNPDSSNFWFWGSLYCVMDEQGTEQSKGTIFTIICPDFAGQGWFSPFQCPPQPVPPTKNDGLSCNLASNPCNVATGNKYQSENDFSAGGLAFTRAYNSSNLIDRGLGKGWRSNHQKLLSVNNSALTLVSGTGRGEPWVKVNGLWQGDPDSDYLITQFSSGFYQVTYANGSIDDYNRDGRLISITDANGHQILYTYNIIGELTKITNHYGQTINLAYSNNRLSTVTDSLGNDFGYEYDSNDNLAAVLMPDLTPEDSSDNPRRIYHYENVDFPNHLTGITDENGDRYGTYAYDANGKAILTEHAQTTNGVGQEKHVFDFQGGSQ